MQKKVFQLLVDNTSGVLSRISGLFSRRGYNIESITAGVTADPRFTRITIVASGDDVILDQIEKQVAKLVDVRDIHELLPNDSVFRELAMVKVRAEADKRQSILATANIFRGNILWGFIDCIFSIDELTGFVSDAGAGHIAGLLKFNNRCADCADAFSADPSQPVQCEIPFGRQREHDG